MHIWYNCPCGNSEFRDGRIFNSLTELLPEGWDIIRGVVICDRHQFVEYAVQDYRITFMRLDGNEYTHFGSSIKFKHMDDINGHLGEE